MKKAGYPFGLFVGWYTFLGSSCWVFLGMTRLCSSGHNLYRFLVVEKDSDPHFESLPAQELFDHVLSPLH